MLFKGVQDFGKLSLYCPWMDARFCHGLKAHAGSFRLPVPAYFILKFVDVLSQCDNIIGNSGEKPRFLFMLLLDNLSAFLYQESDLGLVRLN